MGGGWGGGGGGGGGAKLGGGWGGGGGGGGAVGAVGKLNVTHMHAFSTAPALSCSTASLTFVRTTDF